MKRPVLAAALVATALGLGVRATVAAFGRDLPPDGVVDLELARDLLAGHPREALLRKFHPLAGVLEAGLARLLGRAPDETCGLAVSLAAGALVPLFVALAAAALASFFEPREKRRAEVALAAGTLAAVHPHLASSAATVFNYPLAHAALAGALAAAILASRGRLVWVALAGFAAGLGYLARPDGLVVLAAVSLACLLPPRRCLLPPQGGGREGGTSEADDADWIPAPLTRLLVLALAFAVIASPYVIALHAATGAWRLTLKKDTRHLVGEVDAQAAAVAPVTTDFAALVRGADRPGPDTPNPTPPDRDLVRALGYALRKTSEAAHPLLCLLALAGLVATRRALRGHVPGLAIVAAFVAAHALLKAHEGYLARQHAVGEASVFALEAGIGVVWLARAVSSRARVSPRLALALLLGASAAILLPPAFQERAASKSAGERAAAAFVRAHAPPGRELVVMGESARPVAFLAGGRFVELPRGDACAVVARAREQGASALVLFLRTRGEPAALARIEAELAAAGLRAGESFREERPAPEGGVIVYTWLVHDLHGGS